MYKSSFILPLICISFLYSQSAPVNNSNHKYNRCLKTGRLLGAVAGSTMGIAQLYWSTTNMSGVHGPLWKNAVGAVPSSIIGGYVGYKTSEWTTKQILRGNPKPIKAAMKGALYGAVDGAVTLTSAMLPLLVIGHYMDTIRFNFDNDKAILFKIVGSSILGGIVYGGTFGIVSGIVFGPGISIYMEF